MYRMTPKSMNLHVLFPLLCFGFFLATAQSQSLPEQPTEPRIDIKASLLKDTIEIGEPFVIQIVVRNIGDVPFSFTSSVSFSGDLKVIIRRPRRLPHEFLGVDTSGVSPDVNSHLIPGDARYYYLPVIYDRESESGYLFTEPQSVMVELQLRYSMKGGIKDQSWNSQPLSLTVEETAEKNRGVVDILMNRKNAVAFQTLLLNDETLGDFRKALDATSADSVFRPWLLASLARAYGMSRRQEADVMIGLDYASQLITQFPKSHLADDALMLQAVIQDRMGLEEDARKSLVQLYNTYHTSEYISEGNPLFIKYFNFQPKDESMTSVTNPTWMLNP